MASTGNSQSIGLFGWLTSETPSSLLTPSISASAAGDGTIVLTITAASETDVIYARYRTSTAAWSTQSTTYKITGSGTITITGLTNGTLYQCGIYAKNDGISSDWDFARVIPSSGSYDATELDLALDDEVQDLIDKYGITATFYEYTSETFNPATGAVTKSGASSYEQKIAPPWGFDPKLVDGTLIKNGDMQTIVKGYDLDFEVKSGLEVSFNDSTWKVLDITPYYSGEQISAYQLHIRK